MNKRITWDCNYSEQEIAEFQEEFNDLNKYYKDQYIKDTLIGDTKQTCSKPATTITTMLGEPCSKTKPAVPLAP